MPSTLISATCACGWVTSAQARWRIERHLCAMCGATLMQAAYDQEPPLRGGLEPEPWDDDEHLPGCGGCH